MVKKLVAERNITHLCHFTNVDNLESILEHGLIPRSLLEEKGEVFHFNDIYRLDDCPEASCLSISFPNYKMFYRARCENRENEWVVIRFRPDVLWEKRCAFCSSNAACNTMTCIPIKDRRTFQALENMFLDLPDAPSRGVTGIPAHQTTNPQAEVLVFDTIEPRYILDVNFQRGLQKETLGNALRLKKIYDKIEFGYNEPLFSYRSDYAHWK